MASLALAACGGGSTAGTGTADGTRAQAPSVARNTMRIMAGNGTFFPRIVDLGHLGVLPAGIVAEIGPEQISEPQLVRWSLYYLDSETFKILPPDVPRLTSITQIESYWIQTLEMNDIIHLEAGLCGRACAVPRDSAARADAAIARRLHIGVAQLPAYLARLNTILPDQNDNIVANQQFVALERVHRHGFGTWFDDAVALWSARTTVSPTAFQSLQRLTLPPGPGSRAV